MKRLRYLKGAALAELRESLTQNLSSYSSHKPFIQGFFARRADWFCDSSLNLSGELPSLQPGDDGETEASNAIAIHRALIGLSPSQAADERLWAWLAHEPYWEYMQQRWPLGAKRREKPQDFVSEHYFVGRNVRNLVRHGLARLWWFAQTTYDDKRTDPYELTKVMLEYSDNRQSVMERAFARNRDFVQGLLDRARHWRGHGRDILSERDQFRGLCKEMNLSGGTMLLDYLPRENVFELVDDYIARTFPEAQPPAVADLG
jgi:hypothetical protein